MALVVCPHCRGENHLPEPWPAAGFTCAHCHGVAALASPVTAPGPFADLHDEPVIRPRHHDRRRGDMARAMADGFGWTVGEQFAKLLFALALMAIIGAAFWLVWVGRVRLT